MVPAGVGLASLPHGGLFGMPHAAIAATLTPALGAASTSAGVPAFGTATSRIEATQEKAKDLGLSDGIYINCMYVCVCVIK